jgi:2-polyprenyl-3-methyl-5-hydroxy-6-metoxy-1,4-benzoquinol methylase
MNPSLTDEFLTYFDREAPAFAKHIHETAEHRPGVFRELSEPLLGWARQVIGDDWCQTLANGYMAFLVDVNRSQKEYERDLHYRFSSYAEVFAQTYDNPEFMTDYHWGVYVTTFVWEHHLLIYDFFLRHFIALMRENQNGTPGRLLDLGCGSGIWSTLLLRQLENWHSTMVDISATTIGLTRRTLACAGLSSRTVLREADALRFRDETAFDAGVSCFLLEHLETPQNLLDNLAAALGRRGLAFVTTALTAAEIDHIFEFRRESEVIDMAEKAGFRVVASFSSAPQTIKPGATFLPRSMALVLQKRAGEYW